MLKAHFGRFVSWVSALALFCAICSPAALAQRAADYAGEVVIDAGGRLVPPWKEVRSCKAGNECFVVILNPQTHEIAKYKDRWASKFEPSGNGKEVWRAEKALDKAIRLNQAPAAKNK